jgi:hypothetical protein
MKILKLRSVMESEIQIRSETHRRSSKLVYLVSAIFLFG